MWGDHLKLRLTSFVRQTRKPFYRPKKEKKVLNKKKEESEADKQEIDDDGTSISSQAPSNMPKAEDKKKEDSNLGIIGNGLTHGTGIETNAIYDWKMLYEHILKIGSINYAGNNMLSWG